MKIKECQQWRIQGGGGVIQTLKQGGAVSKKIFFALRASVWSKNKGGLRGPVSVRIGQDRLSSFAICIIRHTKSKSNNSYIHNQHVSIFNKIIMLHRFLSGPQQFQDMKLCLFQQIFFKQQLLSKSNVFRHFFGYLVFA